MVLLSSAIVASVAAAPDPGGPPGPGGDSGASWPTLPGQPAAGSPHFDLEVLYAQGRHAEGLAEAKRRLAAQPDDLALHWMVARFLYEVGELLERDDPHVDKEAHYAEMVAVTERGLALAPGDPHLRFARGIANGRLGTTRGVLSSLFLAKRVEADWLAAVESGFVYSSLDGNERMPCDVYLGLGIFYRLVPDWWIVQVLAGTRGDLDTSLAFLEKATTCAPGRIGATKELGVTQLCIGTKRADAAMVEAGRRTITTTLGWRGDDAVDAIDLRHGRMLLEDPAAACAYSRDGQQDLDERKLQK